MSWGCCSPAGECKQGHGCPAGVMCYQDPHCTDAKCPGHPAQSGAKVARIGRSIPKLDGVMLEGPAPKPARTGAVAHLVKRVAQWLGVLLVVVIWLLATSTADSGQCQGDGCVKVVSV